MYSQLLDYITLPAGSSLRRYLSLLYTINIFVKEDTVSRAEYMRKRYAENPSYKEYLINYQRQKALDDMEKYGRNMKSLRVKYGMSESAYLDMYELQKGRCAICGTDNWGGKYNVANVDHDHSTGKVRGLICQNCNTGLGCFKDSEDIILRAAEYIRESR